MFLRVYHMHACMTAVMVLFLLAALPPVPSSAVELGPGRPPRRFMQARTNRCYIDPTICSQPGLPNALECCGSSCVDTSAHSMNCGGCGKVCTFSQACCGGRCVDITFNDLHCGYCGRRCPNGVGCIYGMCNYA